MGVQMLDYPILCLAETEVVSEDSMLLLAKRWRSAYEAAKVEVEVAGLQAAVANLEGARGGNWQLLALLGLTRPGYSS